MRYKKLLPWMITEKFKATYLIGAAAKPFNVNKLNKIAERHKKSDLHEVSEHTYLEDMPNGEKLLFKTIEITRVA